MSVDDWFGRWTQRPWEDIEMTTARWMKIPGELLVISNLIPTQPHVYHLNGGTSWCGDLLPHVVYYGEKLYVDDGHHRIGAAIHRGEELILARVKIL